MKFWQYSKRYGWNVLISLDQLGNTILGGDPDETISSRAGKNRHRWHWNALATVLDWIDPNHTEKAIEDDEGKNAVFAAADAGRSGLDDQPKRPSGHA
ncbi:MULTISPECIES: hypothetical protein [unclassified Halobacteriovorax]|uniref:hypothetical protein n=1 Tax=unclassified Halobacteriovorax TaxID=2639665 RepID=UPI003999E452